MDSSSSVVNYEQLEQVRSLEIQETLKRKMEEASKRDRSRFNSLRRTVLNLVVSENYDRAKQDLKIYIESYGDLPIFRNRVEPFVINSNELIQAIRTKRNFPGLGSLSLAKQQEIHERVLSHFEELKSHLKRIEKIEKDIRLADVRSTSWFVKTSFYSILTIAMTGFVMDLRHGMFHSFLYVFNQMTLDLSNWVIRFFGW